MASDVEPNAATVGEDVSKHQKRDPERTRNRILKAAKAEFARFGLGGGRVDRVADRAKANKRMIYHYFGSKEELFQAVVEDAYLGIRNAERKLQLGELEPEEAILRLVRFTWEYYLKHPEFLTLVNSENLHRGRHLNKSATIREVHADYVNMVRGILKRGERKGVFRRGIDPVQFSITVAAIGYYYLTNRFTGSIIYGRDLMTQEAIDQRLAFNLDTIMRLLKPDAR